MTEATGPLRGLKVLDLSTSVASAYTSLVFADFGADVVQVEPPGGSAIRRIAGWPFWMRGKQSIVLDLDRAEDVEVVRDLAATSDVVIDAFGAGFAEGHGLGYDALQAANPGLVYTAITAGGPNGVLAHLRPYEAVIAAKTGYLYGDLAHDRPGEPMMPIPMGVTFGAALLAIQGTFIALREREQSGLGQRVDASFIQSLLAQDPWNYFLQHLVARFPEGFGGGGPPSARSPVPMGWLGFSLLNGYTKDGRWLQFSNAAPRQYAAFLRVLGLDGPDWEGAADSEDEDRRRRFQEEMLRRVHEKTTAEWQAIFDGEKDVFAEVYRRDLELFQHPQMVHDEQVVTVDLAELGTVRELAPLVKMSKTPGSPERPVPAVGEHDPSIRSQSPSGQANSAPAAPGEPARRPALEGVLVVDIGTYYAGPFGSTMLTDHGATVVKIEPLEGDPIRFLMPMPEAAGVRVTQGKKSLAVDTFTPEGRQIAVELIQRADIVLHSYRGGVAERMGLGAEEMIALNPNLVYHHGVGYGVDGPYARRAAYAPTIAAGSGFSRRCGSTAREGVDLSVDEIAIEGYRNTGPNGGVHPDGLAALGVAAGAMLGLYARDRGAGGQETMTSMLATMGHVQSDYLISYEDAPPPRRPDPSFYGFDALERLYRASDGWIVVCAPEEREWRALASIVGLADDPRFASFDDRRTNDSVLIDELTKALRERPATEWEEVLSDAGVGCAAVALSASAGLGSELFAAGGLAEQLGLLVEVNHPIFDKHPRSKALVTLSRSEETLGAGCMIGQHTDEVLRELLGYDQARIEQLRSAGIIGG